MATSTENTTLPPPSLDQAYMLVSALEGGHVNIPAALFLEGASKTERYTVPALAFLLKHSGTGTKVVFDLGIRKNTESFPPVVQQTIRDNLFVKVEQDVLDSLSKGGVKSDDIPYIILSHLHFDHIGDASLFPNSTFFIGGGSRKLLKDAYPHNPRSNILENCVPNDGRTRYLDDPDFSQSIVVFPRACDLFNDGSLYIVDAYGHLDGHINVLARTSSTGGWVFLGGDTCHHPKLLEDGKIFVERNEKGEITLCAHSDLHAAEKHIERVKNLRKMKEVQVITAHDYEWYETNKDGESFLPGFIPPRA